MNIAPRDILRIAADHPGRGRIDECRNAHQIDAENPLGRRFQNQFVLAAQLPELLRLTLDRFALSKELHEHADLGAQNLGMKRLEDVVDRAEFVAPEHVRLAAA